MSVTCQTLNEALKKQDEVPCLPGADHPVITNIMQECDDDNQGEVVYDRVALYYKPLLLAVLAELSQV